MKRYPCCMTGEEAEVYDRTPKWLIWEAARDAFSLADPFGAISEEEDSSCDEQEQTLRKMKKAFKLLREARDD